MRRPYLILSFFVLYITSQGQTSIDQKVDSLLNLMTLDEKIGQMTQAERGALESLNDISNYSLGSLLSGGGSAPSPNNALEWANMYDSYQEKALESRLGIPLIYGVDAVHGHNNVYGAVIFPHNIGLGCTWNPDLVRTVNEITATEVSATGIDWNFSPCIAVPRDERWGRTYEGFGETAEIQKIMAYAAVMGLQGDSLNKAETILACAKHFVGDGGTTNGFDQGNTQVSEEILRSIHMAGYIDAIDADVGSIMASYNSWNGQKLHGHKYLLTDVLKEELGFEGFVVSDWKGVDQINEDYRESIKRAINAGIDMVMVPDRYLIFISILKSLVEDGDVSIERIDDAVRRILKQKFLLELFESPMSDQSLIPLVGSAQHRNVARQAVRESLVLLDSKNDVLPLNKNNMKYLVAGPLADDIGASCGGWSISWQGSNGDITIGTSILEGLNEVSESSEIIYSENGNYDDPVDAIIVVIGENPYAEGAGDKSDLKIEFQQVQLVKTLKEKGVPIICVMLTGRPRIIGEIMPYTDAMISAWLPGTEASGVADIIFGDYKPSGKLSLTWPRSMDQIPINYGDNDYSPLYAYKHGLIDFPSTADASELLPYCAATSSNGQKIYLSLSDNITNMETSTDDFTLKINGNIIQDMISDIYISSTEESILIFDLNSEIEQSDKNVSLTYDGSGIFSNSLLLEPLENYFVFNSVNGSGGTMEIPGIIQAENFFEMYGVETETCTDYGGGLNVGYVDPGDWMKYSVEVLQDGWYEVRARISGYSGGNLLLNFNDSITSSINYSSTNGWQSWQNFTNELYLSEGNYIMEVVAQQDAFNINYFDFSIIDAIENKNSEVSNISVYPNPAVSAISLEFNNSTNDEVSIRLYTMGGQLVQTLFEGSSEMGRNDYDFNLSSSLNKGLYFIEIKNGKKRYFQKLMIYR